MPLPLYLTEPPSLPAATILTQRLRALGLPVHLTRTGNTLTIRNLEVSDRNDQEVRRGIEILAHHADANGLSLEAYVYPVQANMISRYEDAGFIVHFQPPHDDGEDAYTLLRRSAR